MGVGRSGTTAHYALLQHILMNQYPGEVDYVYEPFLWDRKTFNKPYSQITDEFRYAASVSVEGMYHHKQLPMLVGEDSVINQSSKQWLANTLAPTDDKRHYLGKMIRANGRVRLIRELSPNTKIIFLIRNPVDVLNSASQLFSFYGSEFYESDFSRFASEVEERYGRGTELTERGPKQIVAEYSYWYFSNLAFLDYAKENPANILSLSYEAFVEDRERIVQRICDFLGLEFRSDYAVASRKKRGPVQQSVKGLSEAEFAFLHDKLTSYESLLQHVDIAPRQAVGELIRTTECDPTAQPRQSLPEFSSLHAGNELRKALGKLRRKEIERARLESELVQIRTSKRYRFINRLLAPIDALRKRQE